MPNLNVSRTAICNARITVLHQPDAGQPGTSHFTSQTSTGRADEDTAREFAFQALDSQHFRKGFIRVAFPEAGAYYFRFERTGVMGYSLTRMHGEPPQALFG